MSASTRTNIIDNLVAAIAAISAGSGYNLSVGQAKRGYEHFNAIPEDKFPAVCVAGADEKRKNHTQREFRSDLLISVVGYVRNPAASDAMDTAILERAIDDLLSDVTKAIMADPTRGGYAVTTELGDVDCDKGLFAPVAAFEMIVRCEYRASTATP